jgi:hypothetical protein
MIESSLSQFEMMRAICKHQKPSHAAASEGFHTLPINAIFKRFYS